MTMEGGRIHLDLNVGMRAVAFVSFVAGISTFIVCGWTFLENRLQVESQLFKNSVILVPKIIGSSGNQNISSCHDEKSKIHLESLNESNQHNIEILRLLRDSVIRISIIAVVLNVVQIISAAYIIGSSMAGLPAQACRSRLKLWFTLNSGLNIAILICFTMPLMYQIGHEPHFQNVLTSSLTTTTTKNLTSAVSNSCDGMIKEINYNSNAEFPKISHLSSFYIGLGSDFVVQFFALIFCLLLLRFNRDDINYTHVEHL